MEDTTSPNTMPTEPVSTATQPTTIIEDKSEWYFKLVVKVFLGRIFFIVLTGILSLLPFQGFFSNIFCLFLRVTEIYTALSLLGFFICRGGHTVRHIFIIILIALLVGAGSCLLTVAIEIGGLH